MSVMIVNVIPRTQVVFHSIPAAATLKMPFCSLTPPSCSRAHPQVRAHPLLGGYSPELIMSLKEFPNFEALNFCTTRKFKHSVIEPKEVQLACTMPKHCLQSTLQPPSLLLQFPERQVQTSLCNSGVVGSYRAWVVRCCILASQSCNNASDHAEYSPKTGTQDHTGL